MRSPSGSPPTGCPICGTFERDRADATEVDIHFRARNAGGARIEIEHRGWDRLGGDGDRWRSRNQLGWDTLVPHFLDAVQEQQGE